MPLTDDILARIRADFPQGEMLNAIEQLEQLQREDGRTFDERILRCVLYVAKGRISVVHDAMELARTDYRDLIVWAEYDGQFETRRRDLSLPFSA